MSSSTNSADLSSPFVPSFLDEQITGLMHLFRGLLRSEIDQLRNEIRQLNPNVLPMIEYTQQATQEATPPQAQQVTQRKKKRNEKTRRQYKRRTLQQAKSTMKKKSTLSSSDTTQTSLLSTIQYWTTKQVMRESACNTPLFTCQHTPIFLAFQHALLLAFPAEYIEYMKKMEAIGQG